MLKAIGNTLRWLSLRFSKPKRVRACRVGMELADLLGRAAVNLDTPELQRFLAGKVILVTGAGGSIGSEICRQTMKFCPSRLVLVEQAENNLFEIDRELRSTWVGAQIVPYIADICDARRIARIFETERPQVVLHCAAHKHVPMMELNPGEAIKNNIFGTKTVADAALLSGAQAFVLISTDKAVNPTSVMGAAKRFTEMYIQAMNEQGVPLRAPAGAAGPELRCTEPPNRRTRFVTVRFGNVLGSSGSVVPIFQKQIAAGGPVTVTHPEMRRYFMTIPEAAQLVLQAGAMGKGGEIFILDMGEPVKILDLAREMIARSGLREGEDIAIEFTGMRPGEKLNEELYSHNERTRPTAHAKIRVWEHSPAEARRVQEGLALLAGATDAANSEAVAALAACVPEFTPDGQAAQDAAGLRVISDRSARAA